MSMAEVDVSGLEDGLESEAILYWFDSSFPDDASSEDEVDDESYYTPGPVILWEDG